MNKDVSDLKATKPALKIFIIFFPKIFILDNKVVFISDVTIIKNL